MVKMDSSEGSPRPKGRGIRHSDEIFRIRGFLRTPRRAVSAANDSMSFKKKILEYNTPRVQLLVVLLIVILFLVVGNSSSQNIILEKSKYLSPGETDVYSKNLDLGNYDFISWTFESNKLKSYGISTLRFDDANGKSCHYTINDPRGTIDYQIKKTDFTLKECNWSNITQLYLDINYNSNFSGQYTGIKARAFSIKDRILQFSGLG